MAWYRVKIETNEDSSEAVEHAFNMLNALGTEINYLNVARGDVFSVSGFFAEQQSVEGIRDELERAFDVYSIAHENIKKISVESIVDQDWLAEWKKHWKPTETDKFIIAPTWSEITETDKHIIRIDPKMAFGTGTHETTRLCLRAIEENFERGMSFLDVGTGTGILSIAGSFLGAREIVACDTDPEAVSIAIENFALNGVNGANVFEGSLGENSPKCDFVCANLTADVIIPLIPLLIQKTAKFLVLSGILKEQEELVLATLESKEDMMPYVSQDGEWISIIVTI